MEVLRDVYQTVLLEHSTAAHDNKSSWIFAFMVDENVSTSELVFQHVVSTLKGIDDIKERLTLETLTVTPADGGASLVVKGVSDISKYCMDESLKLLREPATWTLRHLQSSALLPDEMNLPVRSDVIEVSAGSALDNDLWLTTLKLYRIERMFEYEGDAYIYRVKMIRETGDSYISMKTSNINRALTRYEYELEWKKPDPRPDGNEIIISHIIRMSQIISNNPIPISKQKIAEVRQEYKALVEGHVEKGRKFSKGQYGGAGSRDKGASPSRRPG